MTYLRFHLLFNLPVLLALLAANAAWPALPGELTAAAWVLLAVFAFTTPWDNLAAKWGIWGFPREKYSLRLGYLPIEEYAFFLLQSLNVMLLTRLLLQALPDFQTGQQTILRPFTLILLAASIVPWILVAAQLRWLRKIAGPRANYALHLAWFLPVLYVQWLIAPDLFAAHAQLLLAVTLLFGLYYTLADLAAVRAAIWHFDETQITGLKISGILPWEEIAFFFLTSLLVAQSYLLLLPPDAR